MKESNLLLLILILVSEGLCAQEFLNLDFEHTRQKGSIAQIWYVNSSGYDILPDSKESYSRSRSMRITSLSSAQHGLGVFSYVFPMSLAIGKEMLLRGRIKTNI